MYRISGSNKNVDIELRAHDALCRKTENPKVFKITNNWVRYQIPKTVHGYI